MRGGWPDRLLQVFAALLVVGHAGHGHGRRRVARGVGHPLSWTDEAAGYLDGLAGLFRLDAGDPPRGAHPHPLLPGTCCPRGLAGAELAIQLALALFGGVIAWYSVHLMRTNADIEAMALPLTVAWMYAPRCRSAW